MKRYIFLLILLATASLYSVSLSNNAQFVKANDLYAEKEFDKALEAYTNLTERGIENANLYYNIGNCHIRTNNLGLAILNYKKALRLNSNHKEASNNLQFALSLTKDKQAEENSGFITEIWQKLFAVFNVNTASLVTLILFLIVITDILLILIRFRHREKSVPVFILTILLFFFVLSLMITIARVNSYNSHKPAVLMAESAVGHSGPGEDFSRVFTIHEGMSLSLEEFQKGWALVKLPNGLGGWIPDDTFLKVNP
ncbi:MAG: tetratricopeptide repeat protein [Candidatus Cloacimonetes bacterium]|nr:tetratricopeptide repeat protein [Candidatus Cloacimonadota bacterium]